MKISKSKQELARVISENGGWRDGAESAAQCKSDNAVSFYRDTPDRDGDCWWGEHLDGCDIGQDRLIANWHQSCLSRAEYFHLYPAPDADEWIEWKGGECPVDDGDLIDVKFSDGDTLFGVNNGWDWGNNAYGCNIIAYRLRKHEKSLGGLCCEVKEENKHEHIDAKPTIEQLASDYRNAKDYADRKQQEADDARADANAKLKALELAGEAHGLLVTPITTKQEPELVITRFTGKFHSTKHGDRPSSLDAICDGCGKRFGTHVGFDCRP